MTGRAMTASVLAAALLSWGAATAGQQPSRDASTRPNLSGYWGAGRAFRATESLPGALPPNTVVLADAGALEFAARSFGGLKVKPAALAAALKWKAQDEMTVSRVCLPPSIVYSMQGPFPMEIHQGSELIVMRLEYYDLVSIIFMDGRPHPPANAPNTKVGHSIGWWEGDTLVVDTIGFNEGFWIDRGQLPHTDQLHLLEKYTRTSLGSMRYELTIDDPGAYTKRFTGTSNLRWEDGTELFEYMCQQANQAYTLMVGEGTSVDRTTLIVP